MGTSGGLDGERGHVSEPRAGGRLSLPRREGVGWAGGLLRSSPSQVLLYASDLTSGFQAPYLLLPARPSPCQVPALATLLSRLPRASALAHRQGPANPSELGPHLGSGVLDSPMPLLQRQATSLGLPWPHSRRKVGLPLKEPCRQHGTSTRPSPCSTTTPGNLGLLPCQTKSLRPWARCTALREAQSMQC